MRKRTRGWVGLREIALLGSSGVLVTAFLAPAPAPQAKTTQAKATAASKAGTKFETHVLPFAKKYCVSCHSVDTAFGGVILTKTKTEAEMTQASATWERVAKNLRSLHMPPKQALQPSPAERTQIADYIESVLGGDCKLATPGRVTLRRLNREEYNNTIRDLLGLDLRLADDFPSDDVGYGFDNIGDVLTLSPLLMEKVMAAAETIAQKAIVVKSSQGRQVPATEMTGGEGVGDAPEGGKLFFSQGRADYNANIARGGRYRIIVQAAGQQAGPEATKMAIWVNEKQIAVFEVRNTAEKPGSFEVPTILLKGPQKIGVSFLNDYYNATSNDPAVMGDRNLILNSIEIAEAADALPESHRKLIPAVPVLAEKRIPEARKMLAGFATKAFRRPVTSEEADRLIAVYKIGEKQANGSFEAGIQLGVQAILSSPHFMFKVETEPKVAAGKERVLNGYELATRLSYFIWSSTPDDRLLTLAQNGSLLKPEILKAEVARMVSSPKASALADNFAGQWLQLRKFATLTPDSKMYPTFSESLKRSMITETKMFFQNVLAQDRPVTEFLDAQYSFLNEDLAKHYGVPGVQGPEFRRVSLAGTPRRGILTQGSVLTVTSNPTRTSPVKRGKWVLENILGAPPPPPPPGVGDLVDDHKSVESLSIRERMEQHRANPACANCHKSMDGLGFSLENFDGVGAWRTQDGNFKVDASGELPDGSRFTGPSELSLLLKRRKDEFVRALSEKMLTYALGRGIVAADKCFVDEVSKKTVASGDRFGAMVQAVVLSEPFRNREIEGVRKTK
ncbi:MAG: DUF1592 domain-containing protein [Fimbriimonas sp.]